MDLITDNARANILGFRRVAIHDVWMDFRLIECSGT